MGFFVASAPAKAQVVINEFLADNALTNFDDDGDNEDWVELLNLGDEDAINSVNIPANLQSKVPYMEKGQFVVYSPDNSEPVELIGLPKCLTRHGS